MLVFHPSIHSSLYYLYIHTTPHPKSHRPPQQQRPPTSSLPADIKGKAGGAELAAEKGKASSKKSKRRGRKPPPTLAQRLFDACRDVFSVAGAGAGFVPPPDDVARIRSILDSMSPADVGLTPNMSYFRNIELRGTPAITYLQLYECPKFSIGIFCLPPSAVIPLHNHPSMTVFSKILLGSMHIKSYDWVHVSQDTDETPHIPVAPSNGVRLAKLKTNSVFTAPCETSILYPADGGNMHCFTAKTACAVLDVLGPPYSDAEGRPCAYYYDLPYESFSGVAGPEPGEGEVFAWLKERPKPDDCLVVAAPYRGPKIVDK